MRKLVLRLVERNSFRWRAEKLGKGRKRNEFRATLAAQRKKSFLGACAPLREVGSRPV